MNNTSNRQIFIAGGSGYIGRALIPEMLKRNHIVKCLVREKSINKLPEGSIPVIGDALNNNSYKEKVYLSDTFIHLVGVSHPSPFKADQFRKIDLVSLQQSVEASVDTGINHFIYLSVAHPAPVMKHYIGVREECEQILIDNKLNATIISPWYILGPGHRWPYLLIPFYKLFENISSTSTTAKKLGLITLNQVIQTLISVIENPVTEGIRVIEVPEIKKYLKTEQR